MLLRRLKNSEVHPVPVWTRNTVRALQERGLIAPAEGHDPLRVVWHLQKTTTAKKSRKIGIRKLVGFGCGRRMLDKICRRKLLDRSTLREYDRTIREYKLKEKTA